MKNVLYLSCSPSEKEFVLLFNILENYLHNDVFLNSDCGIKYGFFEVQDDFNSHQTIDYLKKQTRGGSHSPTKAKYASIIVDIIVPDDDSKIDTSFYRYLLVLKNQILRKNDLLVFTCNNVYYNKISSFLLLENLFSDSLFAYDVSECKAKRFSTKFSVSSEWFPAMSFGQNEQNGIYDILSLPLYKSKEHFNNIFNQYKEQETDLNLVFDRSKREGKEHIIKTFFNTSLLYWLEDVDENAIDYIAQYASCVSSLTILILAIQLKFGYKKEKIRFSVEDIAKLMNISCDFSEGILQIIENMICHSSGGSFIFRLNNHLEKLDEHYKYNKDILDIESYIRISLIDYSKRGIASSIKEKSKISCNISLNEVFDFENLNNKEYEEYLLSDDSTVHHYGLSIFKSIILQYKGCFIVKSKGESLLDDNNVSINYSQDGLMPKVIDDQLEKHISGTEYDIALPLSKTLYKDEFVEGITSVSFGSNSYTQIPETNIIFDKEITDFFFTRVNNIIRNLNSQFDSMQELKENTINRAATELSELIKNVKKENPIVYFFLDNALLQYRRTEIIAKIILKTFTILNKSNLKTNFVLFGFSDQRIYSFIRQFALFYRKGQCTSMKNNQLYIVSNTYKTEVLLYGQNLNTSYEYLCQQRFNYGVPSDIVSLLKHINRKTKKYNSLDNDEEVLPINYNILPRMEILNGSVKKSDKKWFYSKLYTVINTDIHEKYLGCKIPNTHVRVNNIHIDSFYECQLLFGNSFWCDIFATCLSEYVIKNLPSNNNSPIILYGYETYSEPLLVMTKQKLCSKLNVSVEYLIFENSKYITTTEKSTEKIRYFESVTEKLKKQADNLNIVFVSGISTTLSTFKNQLYKQLCLELKVKNLNNFHNLAFVVVQVDDKCDENNVAKNYIKVEDLFVYSKKGYLDFTNADKCGYLISVDAKWYLPNECPLCIPAKATKEKILVETNETSTVPMTLIKPKSNNNFVYKIHGNCDAKCSFLDNINNKKYLYYCHLNRNGNHHQYYIRTANFVQDNLYAESELCQWLLNIKNLEEKNFTSNTINIIICPSHFSNESFASAVNQYIFNNQAYIISLDMKKEFRDSFEAKFSNYKTMLEIIQYEMPEVAININFYYVDDHIVSGATFQRAKSLIKGLVSEYIYTSKNRNFHIELFKALIILVNRNSSKSISSFFDNYSNQDAKIEEAALPFYSFINLKTPSIRSYGDSCPICQKVKQLEKIVNESSLYSTEKYWRSKLLDYETKNLQQAKAQKKRIANRNNSFDKRGFRRLQCSEIIWNNLNHCYETIDTAKCALEECMLQYLKSKDSNEDRLEYLISFIKVMCRPHIIYQENINSAILQILLDLYQYLYFEDYKSRQMDLYKFIRTTMKKCSNELKYDLYRAIIACLCSLGSNLFYRNDDTLISCYKKGIELESNIKDNVPSPSFDDFLRFQIKINMFSNKDSAVKAKKLSTFLQGKILEMNL